MTELIWLWVAILAVLLLCVVRNGSKGGALVLAYFAGLSLIHVPGALIYTGSAPGLGDEKTTLAGFETTLLGMAAFVGAAWLARLRRLPEGGISPGLFGTDSQRLGTVMLVVGASAYFLALPVLSLVPSATSIASGAGGLLPLGLWFWLYSAHAARDWRRFVLGLLFLPLLPLSTMVTGGFISFGVSWIIAVAAFTYCLARSKFVLVLAAPLIFYVGLSFSVAYFTERAALRDAVWYQQVDLSSRLDKVWGMVERFEWLDLDDADHVAPLNDRLNQNILVGSAIEQRENGQTEPAYGATVPLWVMVPRAIWPEKPAVGGSGDVVSRYTGIIFNEDTSVGVGQPLEFYVNFGLAGVVIGFTVLGYLMMRLDMRLAAAFRRLDPKAVLKAGLPGLALLQPGGSLMEILVAFIGALVAAHVTNLALLRIAGARSRPTSQRRPDWAVPGDRA